MTKLCQFTDTDPLHFKTIRCKAAAVQEGHCEKHQGSWTHVRYLRNRIQELEKKKKQYLNRMEP